MIRSRYAPLIALAAIVLAGCGSLSSGTAGDSATVPSAAPPSCASQVAAWRSGPARPAIQAVESDLTTLGKTVSGLGASMEAGNAPAGQQAAVQADAAALQADAQTAQAILPPACAGNARQDLAAGLGDSAKIAIGCDNAISEIGSQNYDVASADFTAAGNEIAASVRKFSAAADALNAASQLPAVA